MIIRIGDLVKIRTGKLNANASSENGQYPFFTCSEEPLLIDSYSYDCECVLVAGNGSLNVKYYYGKFDAYQRTYIIESLNKNVLDVRYLYYFLNSYIDVLREKSIGGIIKYIKLDYLTEVEISLPSLIEQKKIVEKMDLLSSMIEKNKRSYLLCDNLVKSQFIEMFGDINVNDKKWPIVHLPEISVFYNGLTYSPKDINENGTIVLRSSNIQNGLLDFDDIVRVNRNINNKYFVNENDILMCSRNGSAKLVGKVALINNVEEPMCFGAFMMIIRSKYSTYLKTIFESDYFRGQISSGISTTTINQITKEMLKKVYLPLPNDSLLISFDCFYHQIDKSKFRLKELQSKLETLYKSLLQKYFVF